MAEAVLIVDDNELNLRVTQTILLRSGYVVKTASSGSEALRTLDTYTPQLMLLDLMLPDISGLDLCRRLKSDPRTHGIIIVALTAYSMDRDKETALAAGCDDYMAKPVDARTLPQLLRRHFDAKR